ncbi:MAG TPA: prepilin-type N-terminal cleavage/methylation domain-containing protein [Symbiobacteriaceae bacterium]|nr:prepilin-type N-terminal cleavage/methylation domain-containing protein [Symbiobacteriaceae bacterium]
MLSKISARLRKREGFTLIELLVVVAIIGLLATLAMPRVFESINKAKRAQGDADLHTISTAIEQLYMQSTNNKYPVTSTVAPVVTAANIRDMIVGTNLLKAHARNLTNPMSKGYIYVTDANADWYVVVDPADATSLTLTCNSKTETLTPTAAFQVVLTSGATPITAADVKATGCTVTNSTGQKFSAITS